MGKRTKPDYKIGIVNPISAPNFTMNAAELNKYLPEGTDFNIVRAYWITKIKGEKKSGQHAHTNEDEIFIILQGNATLILDKGNGIKKEPMATGALAWVPRYIWHGFEDFSDDCILLALSNTNYDPERKGYIEDYDKFKKR